MPPLPPPPPPDPRTSASASDAPPESTRKRKWDPEDVVDAPKSKKWWQRGSRGRKKKLRSVAHWLKQNQANFTEMGQNDFTQPGIPDDQSPSFAFRQTADKYQVIRYFCFLIQMVMTLVRVWKPTRQQVKHYGLGVHTPQRRALIMMHSGELPQESQMQLKSLQRHLWGRVAKEAVNLSSIESVCRTENESDHHMAALYRLRDHISDVMLPGITSGKYPPVAVDVDPQTQYSECWKDHACVWLCDV